MMRRGLLTSILAVFLAFTLILGALQNTNAQVTPTSSPIPTPTPTPTPPTSITLKGASFAAPETLKDDIDSYKQDINRTLPNETFLLAKKDAVYLVFANKSDKGEATVEGILLNNTTLARTNVGVIRASNVSINKEGTPVTIREILDNLDKYELELVKINAFRYHISISYDPDEPNDKRGIEFPITIGYLTNNTTRLQLVKKAIQEGENLSIEPNWSKISKILKYRFKGIPIFDFETEYWTNCSAENNGIVLTGSKIRSLLWNATPSEARDIFPNNKSPIIYDVKSHLDYTNVSSVDEIYKNLNKYAGKVIGLSAKGLGGQISVQECLEHCTSCTEDYYPVRTKCVNIIFDVLLEGGIAWNNLSIPPQVNDSIATVGISSKHQDKPFDGYVGKYNYIGRVISLRQINKSLNGTGLIIFKKDRIGSIDWEEIPKDAINKIKNKTYELNSVLIDFVHKKVFDTGPGTCPSISGTHTGTIKLSQPIYVSKLYTYPCPGTGGHTEYVRIWGNGVDTSGTWEGYTEDWSYVALNKTIILESGKTYNYTIRTGSYPQIIHAINISTPVGAITCTRFVDTNGKEYQNWMPAIRTTPYSLEKGLPLLQISNSNGSFRVPCRAIPTFNSSPPIQALLYLYIGTKIVSSCTLL